ncbi:MAG: class I SAM-dependent methyltransferase [Terriglobia bacterium]
MATFLPTLHLSLPALGHSVPYLAAVWNPANREEMLNSYLQARASHWRDVYFSDGLSGFLYRVRKDIVLDLVNQLDLPSGSRVLDVGCGAGFFAVALAQRGFAVHAVDAVPAMVEQTRRLAKTANVHQRVQAGLGDIQRLNFPDRKFDAALAIGVIPWVDDPNSALRELSRVIRPGGHIILAVDNSWSLTNILDPLCFPGLRGWRRKIRDRLESWGILEGASRGPRLRFHTIREFDSLLSDVGLVKVEGRTFGFGPFTFLKLQLFSDPFGIRLHRKLQRLADRGSSILRSTGIGYVVLARKPA